MTELATLISEVITFVAQGGTLAMLLVVSALISYHLIFLAAGDALSSPRPTSIRQQASLHYAGAIAYCQPLAGLLGTVQGMIGGFAAIAERDAGYSEFAGHISSALTTTGLGLVFALPALLMLRLLKRRLASRASDHYRTTRAH